jgi:hypothetical protein
VCIILLGLLTLNLTNEHIGAERVVEESDMKSAELPAEMSSHPYCVIPICRSRRLGAIRENHDLAFLFVSAFTSISLTFCTAIQMVSCIHYSVEMPLLQASALSSKQRIVLW